MYQKFIGIDISKADFHVATSDSTLEIRHCEPKAMQSRESWFVLQGIVEHRCDESLS